MESQKVYQIEDLDVKQHSFILIASKRCSGKSVLVRNLVKHLLDLYEYSAILLFSETAELNKDYNFIDKSFIYKTSQIEEKLNKLLKIQERNVKNNKDINILIILDDVQIHSNKNKELINVSTLGRHYKITCILSLQYPKQLCSSSIRNNLDYVIFSDLGEIATKAIYESIHIPLNFKEFKQYINDNNHDYQFIMYDGKTQNRNERLKVIKAKIFDSLKLLK